MVGINNISDLGEEFAFYKKCYHLWTLSNWQYRSIFTIALRLASLRRPLIKMLFEVGCFVMKMFQKLVETY